MVLLVVVIAIALYAVLYFNGEYLTQKGGVGVNLLWSLQQMLFGVPQNTFMMLFKGVIALLLVYLVVEAVVNLFRPNRRKKHRKYWRDQTPS